VCIFYRLKNISNNNEARYFVKIINNDTPPPLKFVDLKTLQGIYTVYTMAELDDSDDELD
jgi:hypothetical protein